MIALALLLAQAAPDTAAAVAVARGEKLFAQSCAVGYCHGSGGAAARGPRLRGRGFEPGYVVKITRDGIPNTAMPAWKDRLKDDDINAIGAYIESLATAGAASADPAVAAAAPAPIGDFEGPAEVKKGRDLFFDATRGTRCGTCHALGGFGVAIGPDLSKVPAKDARELGRALRVLKPKNVRTVHLKDGESFAAIVVERAPKLVRVYDLASTMPVLRSFLPAEIRSIAMGTAWRHESAIQNYSGAELTQTGEFVSWMGTKK